MFNAILVDLVASRLSLLLNRLKAHLYVKQVINTQIFDNIMRV